MATSEKPVMVVGVDESEQSIYALEWALDHFFAPHAPNFHFDLVIVRAKPSPISVVRISGPGSGQALPYGDADLKKIAARVIEQAKELCISKSVDLDLGNYERFLDVTLTRDNITTGKIYQSVLEKERKGDYLGKAVQHDHYMTRKRLVQYVSSVAGNQTCQWRKSIRNVTDAVGAMSQLVKDETLCDGLTVKHLDFGSMHLHLASF